MTVQALILAGGRGSRLGDVRKGELRIGGRTLLERVTERLGDLPAIVSTGPGPTGIGADNTIADGTLSFGGPMAGIAAALRHLHGAAEPGDLLLTMAVDTPFLPRDFAARMIAALDGGAQAAYAAWGQQIYPTNAIYRLSGLYPLLSGTMPDSPKRLLQSLGAGPVDWTSRAAADPFVNLNTLADLIALGRRARAGDE
ncbi:molybdenum cofactor guanylyltransferase [Devosia sp. YIM 151766]|uniref:molybdenum cofactor guanylyltransferase n=1 Tax=Devosia sp. YIM 151766 TaxID=3017325 RepID=UPI00255CC0DE|nr:molybdenum cofactor guanylyltransferase [Devosia sp. YIM 151766]WIY54099.1 molybdenum cofactor guanylyltransferase [Devosia sp. YIM 151766]